MKKIINLFALFLLLNSCENVQKGLGMKKDVPDEFLIEKRNPLTMPPNFDLLPPDSVNQNNQKDEKDNLKDIFNKNLGKDKKDTEINKGTNSGSFSIDSGAGGDGIVIIAYAKDGSDGISTSTGGTITSTATDWVHTFTTSGSWNPTVTGGASEATTTPAIKLEGDVELSGDISIQG